MDMPLIFLSAFVFGILVVAIWALTKDSGAENRAAAVESRTVVIEGRTTAVENRATAVETPATVLENNVGSLNTTTVQSIAYLSKLSSAMDFIQNGNSLQVPDPPGILASVEEDAQQGGPRGVTREFHF